MGQHCLIILLRPKIEWELKAGKWDKDCCLEIGIKDFGTNWTKANKSFM